MRNKRLQYLITVTIPSIVTDYYSLTRTNEWVIFVNWLQNAIPQVVKRVNHF